MPQNKNAKLTEAEEERCLSFLHSLHIDAPDHPIFERRGFFGLFLNGLQPDELPEGASADRRDFQEVLQFLVRAGVPHLQGLLKRQIAGIGAVPLRPRPWRKELVVVKPSEPERDHFRHLPHAETPEHAMQLGGAYLQRREFLDGHHILAEFLSRHGIDRDVLTLDALIIEQASNWDRDGGLLPENMLFECEELATILSRQLPLLERNHFGSPQDYDFAVGCARLTYRTWAQHARSLLLHRYHMTNAEWVVRNWIDPQDFGFLVDIMRLAVRSRLPLNLLREIYRHIRDCIHVGKMVIVHDNKKSRFDGDVLRIIASPTKDEIPDLCFEIFRDIIEAYRGDGDTQTALLFCKQALMIHKNNAELLLLRQELIKNAGRTGWLPA